MEEKRCTWCLGKEVYERYHDEEWGRPVVDDKILFEFLVLESAQAGLSWITVLQKRAAYKEAFHGFDAQKAANMTEADAARLWAPDSGIIKNKAKIRATISNARLFLELQKEFGSFKTYIWSFLPGQKPIINHFRTMEEIPAETPISQSISQDMKKRGFKFFGSTICYAHMQATGMVNDHVKSCPSWQVCTDLIELSCPKIGLHIFVI